MGRFVEGADRSQLTKVEPGRSGEVNFTQLEDEATAAITFVKIDGLPAPRVKELLAQSGEGGAVLTLAICALGLLLLLLGPLVVVLIGHRHSSPLRVRPLR